MKPVFALDVGGVLASRQHDGQPRAGAIVALAQLHQDFDLWVVSQCGRNRALKTREWIANFGLPIPHAKQIYIPFGKSKVPHLKELKAVYFVDDRIKHVGPALGVSSLKRVFHMPEPGMELEVVSYFDKYRRVDSWDQLISKVYDDYPA